MGPSGIFAVFYVITILKTSKISIFCMFLQESQIASNTIQDAKICDKTTKPMIVFSKNMFVFIYL